MAKRRQAGVSLGAVLRRRRLQLELTQRQVADRVGCRSNYIGYLEADVRRPSPEIVKKLASVLDLDAQELFFLAHPQARALVAPAEPTSDTAWHRFKANKRLHTRYGITSRELSALEAIAALGPVRSQRDFLFILQAVRQALTEE